MSQTDQSQVHLSLESCRQPSVDYASPHLKLHFSIFHPRTNLHYNGTMV